MNSLITDNGILLKKNNRKYKQKLCIFIKSFILKVDLNTLLGSYSIPKLNKSEKTKMEGKITYEEILFCFKKSSNNISPGFDGFTYDFFKFF